MSRTKSISDLVTDLQRENDSLQSIKRSVNALLKKEFGYSLDELHHIVDSHEAYEARKAEKKARQNNGQQQYQASNNM